MKYFCDMIEEALVRAEEAGESRFLGETSPGTWRHYAACEEGDTPDLAIEVTKDAGVFLIENRPVTFSQLGGALRKVLCGRKAVMQSAGDGARFDAAQDALQQAIREAEALLYKLPDPT